jgi:hypothetical protein
MRRPRQLKNSSSAANKNFFDESNHVPTIPARVREWSETKAFSMNPTIHPEVASGLPA